ncbi:nuclear factor of activated T-cells 5-like isoform X4 [Myxocyprinus asiaticus]|uniref:nuclear factor of activated T-cells 5-like isoform X4 n=1 Tax=Myxocyprinus asiaticus TaxID=70543 RepID=UPI002222CAEA|nr:nuclear factor of activated T-cells 5-like isoform X4 [Myxocyprinus asiaticus]
MPSDFISLLSADIDPGSPKSLYSKESVYDLLPKELQLPSAVQQENSTMSQKSGGEAGHHLPAALVSDAAATCTVASPGGLSSIHPSCPSMLSAISIQEQTSRLHSGPAAEGMGEEHGPVVAITGVAVSDAVGSTQSQATPSKRRTVLSISPPPEDLLDDSRMSCQDDLLPNPDSEQSGSMWMDESVSNFSLASNSSYNDNTEVPRKSRKRTPRQRPGPKPAAREEDGMDVFDADSAKAPHFVLSQLGSDTKVTPKASSLEVSNNLKGGVLSIQYPQKSEGKELKILIQPETQHRARYLTEGSRGSVKDRTQQGFPKIKLEGVNEPVVLQVFVANDAGRVKPHGFYQACRVTGRNTMACKEVDIEGTTVIEVNLDPSNAMMLAVDCVGILKLRNADVEARIGVAGSKKKSTRARLAFRVNISRPDGSVLTLQTLSSPILCTQPAGVPEILKKSLHSCSVAGGEEVFIIGKNFLKGTKVVFQENSSDESGWQAEAEIDMELFHQNHLVVKVPPYRDQTVTSPVSVGIAVVTDAGRTHDLQPFTYNPLTEKVDIPVKSELPATIKTCTFEEQIKAMQTETRCLNTVVMLPVVKREEPMEVSCNATPSNIFKDQTSIVSDSSASMPSTQSELFQDQQPMQVVPSTTSITPVSPTDQPSINLFLPQSAISALQSGVSAQELPPTATAATIFSGRGGVALGGLQNTTPTPTQQTPSQLFQTTIGGTLSQPGQAGLFLFEIPSECGQLINSPGPTLSDQLVTMGHAGSDQNQSQLQTSAQIQTLLDQTSNLDDKIDELLEQFQEQGTTLPRDFLDH